MYFALTLLIGIALLVLEVKALSGILRIMDGLAVWRIFLASLATAAVSVTSARYIGLAEYPLPCAQEPNVTAFGFPILALVTKHYAASAVDFGGPFTLPAVFLNFAIAGLLPVAIAYFALRAFRK
ncbi:MAG: hypothetical protein EG824_01145 [Deltaproteobacteria bacterium]|nr:hypothetical protein [Deltaproteobacteria bacterium]